MSKPLTETLQKLLSVMENETGWHNADTWHRLFFKVGGVNTNLPTVEIMLDVLYKQHHLVQMRNINRGPDGYVQVYRFKPAQFTELSMPLDKK